MDSFLLFAQDAEIAIPIIMLAIWAMGMLLGLVGLIAWVWAVISAAKNPELSDESRIIWILVIVVTGIFGAIAYYLVGDKFPKPSSTAK